MTIVRRLNAVLIAFVALFSACDAPLDKETTLTFTGDSLIARWDLQSFFSSLATTNLGESGAGIDYIESLSGTMKGRNVVVMIGTNNSYLFADEEARKSYEQRYLAALDALDADKIYLYEVLPREFNDEDVAINEQIRLFNSDISSIVSTRSNIVYMKVFDSFIDKDDHICWQYYTDGLHLSPEGYEILASVLFKNI